MRELLFVFQEVEDPRRGNAKRHDLHEMLLIALLATLTGGRACVEMEDYGCAARGRSRQTAAGAVPSGPPRTIAGTPLGGSASATEENAARAEVRFEQRRGPLDLGGGK